MTWQEYQQAVSKMYETMTDMGIVKHNIRIPDKITGQKRQIDTWWEIKINGHRINVLIDAKYRKGKIDIKDLEEVEALAASVKAHKIIIVTNKGWTKPAMKKANFCDIDLKILKIEDALDLIIPDKWFMCHDCPDECVVMDSDGILYREDSGLFFDWYAGRCRKCKNIYFHCPGCGKRIILENDDEYICYCKHVWKKNDDELFIKFENLDFFQRIDNAQKATPRFLLWLLGYPREYWFHELAFRICSVKTDKGNIFHFMIHPVTGELIKPDYIDEGEPVFLLGI